MKCKAWSGRLFTGEGRASSEVSGSRLQIETVVAGSEQQAPVDAPFILIESLPVIPVCLVKKVSKAEFVNMANFLEDNMEAERYRLVVGEGTRAATATLANN